MFMLELLCVYICIYSCSLAYYLVTSKKCVFTVDQALLYRDEG